MLVYVVSNILQLYMACAGMCRYNIILQLYPQYTACAGMCRYNIILQQYQLYVAYAGICSVQYYTTTTSINSTLHVLICVMSNIVLQKFTYLQSKPISPSCLECFSISLCREATMPEIVYKYDQKISFPIPWPSLPV